MHTREAKSLHAEMLRRKLVLPVAGFLAGLAIVGGVGVASASNPATPSPTGTTREVVEQIAPVSHEVAAPTTTVPVATTTPPPPPTTQPVAPTTAEQPAARPEPVAPAAQPNAHPVVEPDDTPVGIPPNETVTIIQP